MFARGDEPLNNLSARNQLVGTVTTVRPGRQTGACPLTPRRRQHHHRPGLQRHDGGASAKQTAVAIRSPPTSRSASTTGDPAPSHGRLPAPRPALCGSALVACFRPPARRWPAETLSSARKSPNSSAVRLAFSQGKSYSAAGATSTRERLIPGVGSSLLAEPLSLDGSSSLGSAGSFPFSLLGVLFSTLGLLSSAFFSRSASWQPLPRRRRQRAWPSWQPRARQPCPSRSELVGKALDASASVDELAGP